MRTVPSGCPVDSYFDDEVRDGTDNVRLAVYFYEMGSIWEKMYLYNPSSHDFNVMPGIGSLASGESLTLRAAATFPVRLFVKETPLYYMSSIVPTLYLVLEMPGQVPVFSALPENVFERCEVESSEEQVLFLWGNIFVDS